MVLSGAVAVNATLIGGRPTGLGVFAVNVVGALAARGERLLVYTSRPELVTGPAVAVERVAAALQPEHGTSAHLRRLLWTQLALRRSVRRLRPRALVNLMPEGLLFSPVAQVTTVLDLFPLHFAREYPRMRYYFRYWVPAVIRHSQAVLTISEASRQDIVRFYGVDEAKIRVAPCGYDARRFTPDGARAAARPYVLYVGNVMPHKNLPRLVDAFATIAPQVGLALVIRGWGHPAHVEAVRERIARHALEGRVDWEPYADDQELPDLYRGARVLVVPSLAEGFGLTALEAMACGTPVVASNTSSLPEVVGDAGLLVDPRDTGALADAIARVATDEALAKSLREGGLERARRFSWERTAAAVQGAIRAATGEAA